MHRPAILTVLMALAVFLLPAQAIAETLYVKKNGTKMHKEDSGRSDVVTTLNQGAAVEVQKKTRRFYQVLTEGNKKGWIFKFKLTSKKPDTGGPSVFDVLGSQQMAAKESASGSSIRGLSPVSEAQAQRKGAKAESIEAVKQMETFKVSPDEVDQFIKQGKLGEYAE